MQKPLGPPDSKCPLWRKPMSKVCHQCEWWGAQKVQDQDGKNERIEWRCAISWLPSIMVEVLRKTNAVQVETNQMRNQLATTNNEALHAWANTMHLAQRTIDAAQTPSNGHALGAASPKLIEG